MASTGIDAAPRGAALWLLVLTCLALAGLAWVLWPVGPSPATQGTAEPVTVREPEAAPPPAGTEAAPISELPSEPQPVVRNGAAAPARASGVIAGVVQVDDALLGKVETVNILVEEAINDAAAPERAGTVRRFQTARTLNPSGRTGSFELTGIPFSGYGWRVSAFAPSVNGSEEVVQIQPDRPRAEVFLRLHPPTSIHLVVKDQDRQPMLDVPITLRPVGRPHQRPVLTGKTDAYGFVLHENVLSGTYRVIVGPETDPALPIKEIEVGAERYFEQLTLPRGGALIVEVVTPAGTGIAGVKVEAVGERIDRVYRKYEGETANNGQATLHHLPPGRYSVHFTKKGFERGFQKVAIEDKKDNRTRVTLSYDFR